jgi:hypothetical protein
MKYFKASQPVPNKGDAETFYECDDDQTVLRYVTVITVTGETERVADPVVKRLYRPELLVDATAEEFLSRWGVEEV